MRKGWIAAAAAALLVGGGIVGVAGANFAGTDMYYDDDGVLVGEANFNCRPNQAWGVVTENVVTRAGCGLSQ
ncbi:DUF6289 family protein [Luteimonas abyssi]|uniref:DUF6289 family protein n=1 Tax=Luteimonas abyssi TaxID=1247514 RepID=UPI000737B0D4|nr:DUF6289 family protein [Luteimonas abyssi]